MGYSPIWGGLLKKGEPVDGALGATPTASGLSRVQEQQVRGNPEAWRGESQNAATMQPVSLIEKALQRVLCKRLLQPNRAPSNVLAATCTCPMAVGDIMRGLHCMTW